MRGVRRPWKGRLFTILTGEDPQPQKGKWNLRVPQQHAEGKRPCRSWRARGNTLLSRTTSQGEPTAPVNSCWYTPHTCMCPASGDIAAGTRGAQGYGATGSYRGPHLTGGCSRRVPSKPGGCKQVEHFLAPTQADQAHPTVGFCP